METLQPTPTIEDYLSLIFSISFDQEKITGAKMADYLHVSAPTVTATLQRMERDGWISVGDKKQIALTEKGQSAALAVVNRHILVECLLYEDLGMPLSSIHDEAHRIEHAISQETESYLMTKFQEYPIFPVRYAFKWRLLRCQAMEAAAGCRCRQQLVDSQNYPPSQHPRGPAIPGAAGFSSRHPNSGAGTSTV